MEVRTRLCGSLLPPCSMAFMSSSRKAAETSSLARSERCAVISRRKWVVRSAASILQRTSRVIHSGRAETTRMSSCQAAESSACCTSSDSGSGGEGVVQVAEGALADGV